MAAEPIRTIRCIARALLLIAVPALLAVSPVHAENRSTDPLLQRVRVVRKALKDGQLQDALRETRQLEQQIESTIRQGALALYPQSIGVWTMDAPSDLEAKLSFAPELRRYSAPNSPRMSLAFASLRDEFVRSQCTSPPAPKADTRESFKVHGFSSFVGLRNDAGSARGVICMSSAVVLIDGATKDQGAVREFMTAVSKDALKRVDDYFRTH